MLPHPAAPITALSVLDTGGTAPHPAYAYLDVDIPDAPVRPPGVAAPRARRPVPVSGCRSSR